MVKIILGIFEVENNTTFDSVINLIQSPLTVMCVRKKKPMQPIYNKILMNLNLYLPFL
jgi:hypothetical protein